MNRLLSLSIENYRSFYDKQELSFGESKKHAVTTLFGPNAGGKSNIIRAFATIISCIRNSADANWVLPYEPFVLKKGNIGRPTKFAFSFATDEHIYNYSFAYNAAEIVEEVLTERPLDKKYTHKIFARTVDGVNPYAKESRFGKRLAERTRKDTLLITKGREDNNIYSNLIFDFLDSITIISPASESLTPLYIDLLKENAALKQKTLELIKQCDLAIRDISFTDAAIPEEIFDAIPVQLPSEVKNAILASPGTAFTTKHAIRDSDGEIVEFADLDFVNHESMGTQKFFEIVVPIIDAIDNNKTIFIDEFGIYIHPALASKILSLFNYEMESNAYLILATHSITLLKELDRTEIVLVEKNYAEESKITPLTALGVREGEAYEKRYLAGHYGAMPLVSY